MQLLQGDCLEIMPTLPDASIDAIIADIPYGTTACKWDSVIPFEPMWAQLKRLIRPRGAIVLFGSQPFTSALVMSNPKWFKYEWVWEKEQGSMMLNVPFQPIKIHENIIVFSDSASTYSKKGSMKYIPQMGVGKPYISPPIKDGNITFHSSPNLQKAKTNSGTRYPKTILRHNTERGLHPTQKPIPLMEYLIRTYTNPGQIVLDFTMGSGTTGVACVNTGREFIGIEQDAGYFEIASKCIETAQNTPVQLELA